MTAREREVDEMIARGWGDVPGPQIPADWRKLPAPGKPSRREATVKPERAPRQFEHVPFRFTLRPSGPRTNVRRRKCDSGLPPDCEVQKRLLRLSQAKVIPVLFVDAGKVRFQLHDGRMVSVGLRDAARIARIERLPDHLL